MVLTDKVKNFDIFKALLLFCICLFIAMCGLIYKHNKLVNLDKVGLAKIEVLTSNIQRVSKLELENSADDLLIAEVDNICDTLDPLNEKTEHCFEESSEMTEIVVSIVDDWSEFKGAVMDYRSTGNREQLFVLSEENYSNSSNKIKEISTYIDEYSDKTHSIQMLMITDVILIAIILVKILMNTNKELKQNKEKSKGMYIDTATGIYNRSKCQEIIKTPYVENEKFRAVVIFDLNDLKKTNDSLGHRAGDQLIFDFAQQIKNSAEKLPFDIFVGRYGGDEFMAFIDNIERADVEKYIEAVNEEMNNFNETEGKPYKLSCAAGYGISTEDNRALTVKELFDIADEDMYKNKIAMKEKKKQELIAQGIEVVDEIDDRL